MGPLSIDAGLVIWTLLTFAGLLALLSRFTFRPLRAILDAREARIRASLEAAEKAREEAAAILEENRQRLTQAQDEARSIIGEGHRIVAEMKKEAGNRAKEDADAIVRQARAEIDRELQRSLEELKGTVANLSVRISRQLIRASLDETRHRELADDFIERLKKTHAAKRN